MHTSWRLIRLVKAGSNNIDSRPSVQKMISNLQKIARMLQPRARLNQVKKLLESFDGPSLQIFLSTLDTQHTWYPESAALWSLKLCQKLDAGEASRKVGHACGGWVHPWHERSASLGFACSGKREGLRIWQKHCWGSLGGVCECCRRCEANLPFLVFKPTGHLLRASTAHSINEVGLLLAQFYFILKAPVGWRWRCYHLNHPQHFYNTKTSRLTFWQAMLD